MTEPQQPQAAPTNTPNSLDDILREYGAVIVQATKQYGLHAENMRKRARKEAKAAINKIIMEALIDELQILEYSREKDKGGDLWISEYITKRAKVVVKKYGRADNE